MAHAEFPNDRSAYELAQCIGVGASSTVWQAYCKPLNMMVAAKIIDMEGVQSTFEEIRKEVQVLSMSSHPNIVTYYTSFIDGHLLWLVMKYFGGGSVLDIMRFRFPKGLQDEAVIATILHEALKGIEYLHRSNQIHRDIKAGNILVDEDGNIQLADFGVSAMLVDGGSRVKQRRTFVGTPCWMAPEVMEQMGYDYKADIWSFGITALELARGEAPYARLKPMQVMMMTLDRDAPTLPPDSPFSSSFRYMIDKCLQKEPSKRPTASKLLEHKFFKQARDAAFIKEKLLKGLPDLAQRAQATLPRRPAAPGTQEAAAQARRVMPVVSAWDFDMDQLKAEAAAEDARRGASLASSGSTEDRRFGMELRQSGLVRLQAAMGLAEAAPAGPRSQPDDALAGAVETGGQSAAPSLIPQPTPPLPAAAAPVAGSAESGEVVRRGRFAVTKGVHDGSDTGSAGGSTPAAPLASPPSVVAPLPAPPGSAAAAVAAAPTAPTAAPPAAPAPAPAPGAGGGAAASEIRGRFSVHHIQSVDSLASSGASPAVPAVPFGAAPSPVSPPAGVAAAAVPLVALSTPAAQQRYARLVGEWQARLAAQSVTAEELAQLQMFAEQMRSDLEDLRREVATQRAAAAAAAAAAQAAAAAAAAAAGGALYTPAAAPMPPGPGTIPPM